MMFQQIGKTKKSIEILHGFMAIVFLIAYSYSGFHLKEEQKEKSLLLQVSNPVEIVMHDAKPGAFQLLSTLKLIYLDHSVLRATVNVAFDILNSNETRFVSFIERNVFYVFISINAP